MRNSIVLAALACLIGTEVAMADEVCRECPFSCQQIGIDERDCSNRDQRGGRCCVDLDNRGKDQLREREQYGAGPRHRLGNGDHPRRDPRRNDAGAYDDRAGFNPGDCPAGFHVNERNCNDEERRRGCMDKRSPSGQICVGWR